MLKIKIAIGFLITENKSVSTENKANAMITTILAIAVSSYKPVLIAAESIFRNSIKEICTASVSYTHLTLPTNSLV